MNPFVVALVNENYEVVGGHDSLLQTIIESRSLQDIREKKKARLAKVDMITFKYDNDGGDVLPEFCVMLPHIGLVTCYEKEEELEITDECSIKEEE